MGLATLWSTWETANARSLSDYLEFMRNSTEEGSEQEYNYQLMYLMPHPSFMLMVYAPVFFFE